MLLESQTPMVSHPRRPKTAASLSLLLAMLFLSSASQGQKALFEFSGGQNKLRISASPGERIRITINQAGSIVVHSSEGGYLPIAGDPVPASELERLILNGAREAGAGEWFDLSGLGRGHTNAELAGFWDPKGLGGNPNYSGLGEGDDVLYAPGLKSGFFSMGPGDDTVYLASAFAATFYGDLALNEGDDRVYVRTALAGPPPKQSNAMPRFLMGEGRDEIYFEQLPLPGVEVEVLDKFDSTNVLFYPQGAVDDGSGSITGQGAGVIHYAPAAFPDRRPILVETASSGDATGQMVWRPSPQEAARWHGAGSKHYVLLVFSIPERLPAARARTYLDEMILPEGVSVAACYIDAQEAGNLALVRRYGVLRVPHILLLTGGGEVVDGVYADPHQVEKAAERLSSQLGSSSSDP